MKTRAKKIDGTKPVLMDHITALAMRNATPEEQRASAEAAEHDGGCGVIEADGRDCYVAD